MKFRSKVVTIDAVKWNGATIGLTNGGVPFETERLELPDWMPKCNVISENDGGSLANTSGHASLGEVNRVGDYLYIGTTEGTMAASPGDWIIRGLLGELYPCKPEVFTMKYEVAE